eukprot:1726927-Rhodomonas_salina.3
MSATRNESVTLSQAACWLRHDARGDSAARNFDSKRFNTVGSGRCYVEQSLRCAATDLEDGRDRGVLGRECKEVTQRHARVVSDHPQRKPANHHHGAANAQKPRSPQAAQRSGPDPNRF